jgi:CheY-like chemotaxis protein
MTDKVLRKFPILLVEDDEIDAEVVRRALKKEHINGPLLHARDGVEALEVLNAEAGTQIAQPCLILLDINMPRMNGLEFLQEIRNNDALKQNIAIILTTSARNEDKITAYNLSVAGYVLKENIGSLVEMLGQYCQINELPTGGRAAFR